MSADDERAPEEPAAAAPAASTATTTRSDRKRKAAAAPAEGDAATANGSSPQHATPGAEASAFRKPRQRTGDVQWPPVQAYYAGGPGQPPVPMAVARPTPVFRGDVGAGTPGASPGGVAYSMQAPADGFYPRPSSHLGQGQGQGQARALMPTGDAASIGSMADGSAAEGSFQPYPPMFVQSNPYNQMPPDLYYPPGAQQYSAGPNPGTPQRVVIGHDGVAYAEYDGSVIGGDDGGAYVHYGQPAGGQPVYAGSFNPVDMNIPDIVRASDRAAVQRFLRLRPTPCSLLIMHSRVVQKSYGNEHRYFSPPPMVILHGDGWRSNQARVWDFPTVTLSMDRDGRTAMAPTVVTQGRAAFTKVFVTDTERQKHVFLYARVLHQDGRDFGTFRSKPIRIISKPSKMRQAAKNADAAITSGMTIGLFNRVRSQNGSTKFLGTEAMGWVARNNIWDTFVIRAVYPGTDHAGAFGDDNRLQYGREIILEDPKTRWCSPELIIRKADRAPAGGANDEPVSELHKVAFQVRDSEDEYLALDKDMVVLQRLQWPSTGANAAEAIAESATWTIVGTARVEYSFYEDPALGLHQVSMRPTPIVDTIKIQTISLVELHGENFALDMRVFFGELPAVTRYRCEELIHCDVPPLPRDVVMAIELRRPLQPMEVPIMLVRNDGMIYPTRHTYRYSVGPYPTLRTLAAQ